MWTCHCCTKVLPDRAIAHIAVAEDGEECEVGSDCIKKIKEAGMDGFQHENGPFVLYSLAAWREIE